MESINQYIGKKVLLPQGWDDHNIPYPYLDGEIVAVYPKTRGYHIEWCDVLYSDKTLERLSLKVAIRHLVA